MKSGSGLIDDNGGKKDDGVYKTGFSWWTESLRMG